MNIPGYNWMLVHWGEKGIQAFCFAFIAALIVSMIVYWLVNVKKWNAKNKIEQHRKGYNFAAGDILRGKTASFIEQQIPYGLEGNAFDKGMLDAIEQGIKLGILKDRE